MRTYRSLPGPSKFCIDFARPALLALLLSCACFGGPHYDGPVTDRFDGQRFHNQEGDPDRPFAAFLRWMLSREPGPWREDPDAEPGPPPPRRVDGGELRVTFVNHATLLVQMDGVNLLTDPIYSERASPLDWIGPRRVRPPGIRFEDLPPIDVVAVSHNHYDHLDLATLERVARRDAPPLLVGLGVAALLDAERIPGAVELDWWQGLEVAPGVELFSVPARHFSSRGLWDGDTTLWCGWVLSGPSGVVYFAGDTGMGWHFQQVREVFGPPRLAALPIGAYRPRWFMEPVHISPRQAVEAHLQLEAGTSIPIHFGTFPLGDDGQDEPVRELRDALVERGVPAERFPVLDFGEGLSVP